MVKINMTEPEAYSILAYLPEEHPMTTRIHAEINSDHSNADFISASNGYGFKTLEEVETERSEVGPQKIGHYEHREDVVHIPLLNTSSIPLIQRNPKK